MATQFKISNLYIYKEINVGKFKTTRHYQLENQNRPLQHLSKLLNVSENRKFAKSNPVYWLKNHNGEKWNDRALTGMFPTKQKDIYYGDINKRQHLLLFRFTDSLDMLIVYYFENYYTRDIPSLIDTINKQN